MIVRIKNLNQSLVTAKNNMTKGEAMYRLFSLAAEAIDCGACPDRFMSKLDFVKKAELSDANTDMELLYAIEEVEPKWKSII